jgi:nitrite reductase/ring-hydroxylating ferredoxin subunit
MAERTLVQRLLGVPRTGTPCDPGCWTLSGSGIVIDLRRAPELSRTGGALRIEGKNLLDRVLVFLGDDGTYRACTNRCSHLGRRLDPAPDASALHCCGLGRSVFDPTGSPISGPGRLPIQIHPVVRDGEALVIQIH